MLADRIVELGARSRSLAVLAAIHVALGAVFLCAVPLDSTLVLGIDRWIKPAKFAISIALYLGTIAWLLPATGVSGVRRDRLVFVVGFTMVVEMVAIAMQAWRGTSSHFNIATLRDALTFNAMGMAILVNSIANVLLCVGAFRQLRTTPSAYQAGVAYGFAIFLVGCAVGGIMVGANAHTIGAADGGPGLPLVNWSSIAGDLRISHFTGMHALQVLPLIGAAAGRRGVYVVATVWCVVTLALLLQALLGHPMLAR